MIWKEAIVPLLCPEVITQVVLAVKALLRPNRDISLLLSPLKLGVLKLAVGTYSRL
jgi:hypothetical protein